jgi:5'-methylthioadenosine phosphorylase
MTETVRIAVIGGSGLYNMPEITDITTVSLDTPFGKPSADITIGTLRGKRVAFLPRHGKGHIHTPSTVPYRANIYALKMLGVRFIISVSACGSLREDYAPGHIVVPDQIFDYTTVSRKRTFFEDGLVAHISVAEPFCPDLSDILYQAVEQVGGAVHKGGTFLIEEGPRFATKAESNIFRQWGCAIIGMTAAPEVFLAREAEISYATMAHITDYDVWHETEEPVTVDMVVATFNRNIKVAQQAVAAAVELVDENADYAAHHALDGAILTARDAITRDAVERLKPIVGRVLGEA